MRRHLSKRDFSILLANTLDHFNTALYSFLAPILAPLFFPHHDPIISLAVTYGLSAGAILARPAGTYIFTTLAIHAPAVSLSYSLFGVAITTFIIGTLPSYQVAGPAASVILVITKLAHDTCAAGENAVAKLLILERTDYPTAFRNSYLHQLSTILGIVLASGASTVTIYFDFKQGWRLCFLVGGLVAYLGYGLRKYQLPSNPAVTSPILRTHLFDLAQFRSLLCYKKQLLRIVLVSNFSCVTYYISFIVMNNIIPLISEVTLSVMMTINTVLLISDMCLIPVMGKLLSNYTPRKIMWYSAALLAATILPLWYFMAQSSLLYICLVRLWIVGLGVAFLCPLNLWCNNLITHRHKYFLVGIADTIGSVVGKMTPLICMSLYYYTGSYFTIALYILLVAVVTLFAVATTRPTALSIHHQSKDQCQ